MKNYYLNLLKSIPFFVFSINGHASSLLNVKEEGQNLKLTSYFKFKNIKINNNESIILTYVNHQNQKNYNIQNKKRNELNFFNLTFSDDELFSTLKYKKEAGYKYDNLELKDFTLEIDNNDTKKTLTLNSSLPLYYAAYRYSGIDSLEEENDKKRYTSYVYNKNYFDKIECNDEIKYNNIKKYKNEAEKKGAQGFLASKKQENKYVYEIDLSHVFEHHDENKTIKLSHLMIRPIDMYGITIHINNEKINYLFKSKIGGRPANKITVTKNRAFSDSPIKPLDTAQKLIEEGLDPEIAAMRIPRRGEGADVQTLQETRSQFAPQEQRQTIAPQKKRKRVIYDTDDESNLDESSFPGSSESTQNDTLSSSSKRRRMEPEHSSIENEEQLSFSSQLPHPNEYTEELSSALVDAAYEDESTYEGHSSSSAAHSMSDSADHVALMDIDSEHLEGSSPQEFGGIESSQYSPPSLMNEDINEYGTFFTQGAIHQSQDHREEYHNSKISTEELVEIAFNDYMNEIKQLSKNKKNKEVLNLIEEAFRLPNLNNQQIAKLFYERAFHASFIKSMSDEIIFQYIEDALNHSKELKSKDINWIYFQRAYHATYVKDMTCEDKLQHIEDALKHSNELKPKYIGWLYYERAFYASFTKNIHDEIKLYFIDEALNNATSLDIKQKAFLYKERVYKANWLSYVPDKLYQFAKEALTFEENKNDKLLIRLTK